MSSPTAAPSATQVKEAITSIRHIHWYKYAGCLTEGKTACKALFSWSELPSSLLATSKSIKLYLNKKRDICPAEEEEKKEEEENTKEKASTSKSLSSRLCDLHRSQAAWKKWGTSCAGEVCEGHEWLTEQDAPLLYLRSTSPRQAVILVHFGLLKEVDVDRLINDDFPVALFVAHLLHNEGMPDEAALKLLEEVSKSRPTCLADIWEDVEEEEGKEEEKNEETKEANEEEVGEEEKEKEEKEKVEEEEESDKLVTAQIGSKKRILVSESSRSESKKSRAEEESPRRRTLSKKAIESPVVKKTLPTSSKRQAPEKEEPTSAKKVAKKPDDKEEKKEKVIPSEKEDDEEILPEDIRTLGAGDTKYYPIKIKKDALSDDMEKLLSAHWQSVYYKQRLLDRKKAAFSTVKSNYHEADYISPKSDGFPDIIEKYRKICQKEVKGSLQLNHCVATLFPKGTSTISAKEEDFDHLQDSSCIYYLTFGSDCPFMIQKDENEVCTMKPRSLLIIGPDTLRNGFKFAFPSRTDSATRDKARIVLAFRSVKLC